MTWIADNGVGLLVGLTGVVGMIITTLRYRTDRRTRSADISAVRECRALDELPFAVLIMGSDSKLVYANRRAVLMTKFAHRDLVGLNINDLVPARFRGNHPSFVKGFQDAGGARPMGRAGTELYMLDRQGGETRVIIHIQQQEPLSNGPETLIVMQNYGEVISIIEHANRATAHSDRTNSKE